MKKLYSIIIATIVAIPFAYAQPAFNFEGGSTSWNNTPASGANPAYDEPKGWATLNILSNSLAGGNPVSIFKSTDAHGGTAACRILTVALNSPPSGWYLQDTIGLIVTGKIALGLPPSITYGYAYASRPSTLEFWSKYTPNGADTASAAIVLLKANGSLKDTIGVGYLTIATTTVSAYTKHVIPIIYNTAFPSTSPDTSVIAFSSSGKNNPKAGSELLIDDIFLGFTSGIDDGDVSASVNIFPNPTNKELNFSFNSNKAKKVSITSSTGQHIGNYDIENKSFKMNAEKLAAGVYIYTIKGESGNVLNSGRFTVTN